MIYSIIAGADPGDPHTLGQPAVTLKDWSEPNLIGLTAGVYPEWFEHADPQVIKINQELIAQLIDRGLVVKEINIPELNTMRVAHAATILSEMALCMKQYSHLRKQHGAAVRLTLVIGEVLNATDYLQAQRVRTRAMNHFNHIFEQVDVILTPGTAKTAQPVPPGGYTGGWSDLSLDTEMMRFIIPGNFLGLPALSFPTGYDARGLPVGMQVIGRHWEENVLLRLAFNAERVTERRLPKAHFG
jgi:Asp-tRNA(Asn)/Glu-tRNA(Gln) amidotransferase A subunit family amidase